jgi:hypothetical protein
MKEAWTKAEAIISIVAEAPTKAESLDRAIAAFKALRRDCPVFLDLIRRGKEIERTATPPAGDDLGHVLWILWWVYFPREGRERLKRCRLAECRKWFVDETKSNTQLQCSTACKWRYWSWSKRREEGHHPAPRKRE